ADGHEGGRTQREKSCVAREDVQADRRQRQNQERQQQRGENVGRCDVRHHEKGKREDGNEEITVLTQRQDSRFLGVVGRQLSGNSVEHLGVSAAKRYREGLGKTE